MGVMDWLKKVLGLGPPARDVSGLQDPSLGVDDVSETVDLSGGPLKPGHRRRALRDRRLLPKKKPAVRLRRRRSLFSRKDAARLFSSTHRTANRQHRDLLPDEEQLARYGLPSWRTEDDVAAALGITVGQLRFFASHRRADRVTHYLQFRVPKRRGGTRVIMAPHRRLKALQRRMLELMVSRLPVSPHAHGFIAGRSILSNATPHARKRAILKMDLQDFFPSVTFPRVRGLFIALGYSFPVATTLAVLLTESERQPVEVDGAIRWVPVGPRHCVQGAPTSPALCNAMVLRMDRRLSGLARKYGFTYTRYADDLAFSTDDPSRLSAFRRHAMAIINDEGFRVRADKTRVMRRGAHQEIAGVTVNGEPGLSRRQRRRIRAMIHQSDRNGMTETQLAGHVAYAAMLNPAQGAVLKAALERARARKAGTPQ